MDINEMNRVLSSEIYKLRSGKAKPNTSNAITKAANAILLGVRLQLTYAKMAGVGGVRMPFFGREVKALPQPQKKVRALKAVA